MYVKVLWLVQDFAFCNGLWQTQDEEFICDLPAGKLIAYDLPLLWLNNDIFKIYTAKN